MTSHGYACDCNSGTGAQVEETLNVHAKCTPNLIADGFGLVAPHTINEEQFDTLAV